MIFKVVTIPHTLFAARHLVNQLRTHGHKAELAEFINMNDESTIFIIYGAHMLRRLPKKYIVFQTEIAGSHHFNPHYLRIIQNAICVWEYSATNIPKYKLRNNNVALINPGIAPQPKAEKDIPILFYGWIESSQRRRDMLKLLRRELNINVVTNILGEDMWRLLSKAKVVLNLHFYENSPLEVFRIHEALSHHCHVVSEGNDKEYANYIHFANNPREMIAKIKDCLYQPFTGDISALDNLEQIRNAVRLINL